jgi:hypothetical protein
MDVSCRLNRQNTTRPTCPRSNISRRTARRLHQPCDLPTAYITPRASAGECVPSHDASSNISQTPAARQHSSACASASSTVVCRVVHVAVLRAAPK